METIGSARLKEMCRDLCRPYGTRLYFPLYPALKRWAKLFRPVRGYFLYAGLRYGNPIRGRNTFSSGPLQAPSKPLTSPAEVNDLSSRRYPAFPVCMSA